MIQEEFRRASLNCLQALRKNTRRLIMKSTKQTFKQIILGLGTVALVTVFTGTTANADVKFGSVAKDKRQHSSRQHNNTRSRDHRDRNTRNDRRDRNDRYHSSNRNSHPSYNGRGKKKGHYKAKHHSNYRSRHHRDRYNRNHHSNFYVSFNSGQSCRYVYNRYDERVRRCYPSRYTASYDRGHHYGYRYHDRYGNYYNNYRNGRYTRSNHRGHHRQGHYYDNKVGQWIALAVIFDSLLDHH